MLGYLSYGSDSPPPYDEGYADSDNDIDMDDAPDYYDLEDIPKFPVDIVGPHGAASVEGRRGATQWELYQMQARRKSASTKKCRTCGNTGHDSRTSPPQEVVTTITTTTKTVKTAGNATASKPVKKAPAKKADPAVNTPKQQTATPKKQVAKPKKQTPVAPVPAPAPPRAKQTARRAKPFTLNSPASGRGNYNPTVVPEAWQMQPQQQEPVRPKLQTARRGKPWAPPLGARSEGVKKAAAKPKVKKENLAMGWDY
ncbi:hypothetical protein ABW21_db0206305 [Orbilia brochopaga]|nr:hypothetical protein ABW21_db0206305 [Drechslerella brochopaga]